MKDIRESDEFVIVDYLDALITAGISVPENVYAASIRIRAAKARAAKAEEQAPC